MFPVVESSQGSARFCFRQFAFDVPLEDRFRFTGGFEAFHAHARERVVHLSGPLRSVFLQGCLHS